MDSSELFQKVSDGEKVFVEGVQGSIPGFFISFQDEEDMFIKKDGNKIVEHDNNSTYYCLGIQTEA